MFAKIVAGKASYTDVAWQTVSPVAIDFVKYLLQVRAWGAGAGAWSHALAPAAVDDD
jgi:hypothetical protein